MTTQSHHNHLEKQISPQACASLTSPAQASGRALQTLAVRRADYHGTMSIQIGS